MRLATADYSFPLLEWSKAIRLASDLAFEGIDISVFRGRSHLKPEDVLRNPSTWGEKVRTTLADSGLAIADVFGIPATQFEELAPNHPDATQRCLSREYFKRLLDFALACGAVHLTSLPGVHFQTEPEAESLCRCADELEWRRNAAQEAGVCFAVEAHTGSIISHPGGAQQLLDFVPGLTLTLDPGHFVCQGFTQAEIVPLVKRTSHFHARCGRPGRLQAPLKENTIDFAAYVGALKACGYAGWLAVEYVWIDWEHCNEVDIVSETILLRNLLRSL